MSKRRYESVEFKRVDWSGLAAGLGGGRAVLAVDVAKEDFVAAVLGPDGVVRVTFKWQHPGQTVEVLGCLGRLAGAVGLEAVLEPSGTYGDALIGQLRRLGIAVYRVSPKRVHDVAEVYDGVPSLHDAKAAELIGRLHVQGVSQVWAPLGQERRELSAWLTRLAVSKARHQAGLNRLEARPVLARGAWARSWARDPRRLRPPMAVRRVAGDRCRRPP
jgi:hypothetical protein